MAIPPCDGPRTQRDAGKAFPTLTTAQAMLCSDKGGQGELCCCQAGIITHSTKAQSMLLWCHDSTFGKFCLYHSWQVETHSDAHSMMCSLEILCKLILFIAQSLSQANVPPLWSRLLNLNYYQIKCQKSFTTHLCFPEDESYWLIFLEHSEVRSIAMDIIKCTIVRSKRQNLTAFVFTVKQQDSLCVDKAHIFCECKIWTIWFYELAFISFQHVGVAEIRSLQLKPMWHFNQWTSSDSRNDISE